MRKPDALDGFVAAEIGRTTAECMRLRARLDALVAEPDNGYAAGERADLENLLALTEERLAQLEALARDAPQS